MLPWRFLSSQFSKRWFILLQFALNCQRKQNWILYCALFTHTHKSNKFPTKFKTKIGSEFNENFPSSTVTWKFELVQQDEQLEVLIFLPYMVVYWRTFRVSCADWKCTQHMRMEAHLQIFLKSVRYHISWLSTEGLFWLCLYNTVPAVGVPKIQRLIPVLTQCFKPCKLLSLYLS